jgi:hypothetical protein
VAAPGEYRDLYDSQMRPFEEARRAAEQVNAMAEGSSGGRGVRSREAGAGQ